MDFATHHMSSKSENRDIPFVDQLSVLVSPENAEIDIVLVHGLSGHPVRTWLRESDVGPEKVSSSDDLPSGPPQKKLKTLNIPSVSHDSSAVYWPTDLLPQTLPHARIITFGYDIPSTHQLGPSQNNMTVSQIAIRLLSGLEKVRGFNIERPLLFIAHGLGGYVVEEILRQSHGSTSNQDIAQANCDSTLGMTALSALRDRWYSHRLPKSNTKRFANTSDAKLIGNAPRNQRISFSGLRQLDRGFRSLYLTQNWSVHYFVKEHDTQALDEPKVLSNLQFSHMYKPRQAVGSTLFDSSVTDLQKILNDERRNMRDFEFSGLDDPSYQRLVVVLQRVIKNSQLCPLQWTRTRLTSAKRKFCMDLLGSDQTKSCYVAIKPPLDGTCQWIYDHAQYKIWLDPQSSEIGPGLFWIKGKPGSGKSTMMKYLVTNSKKMMPEFTTISFFFNARGETFEKNALGLYRSLLWQLLEARPELQWILDDVIHYNLSQAAEIPIRQQMLLVRALFKKCIKFLGTRPLVCFIDALDECQADEIGDVMQFLQTIGKEALQAGPPFRACLSHQYLPTNILESPNELVLEVQAGHKEDLQNYVSKRLEKFHAFTKSPKEYIVRKASGVFLWAVLVVEVICQNPHGLRSEAFIGMLDRVPHQLDHLFQYILTQDGNLEGDALLCIQWISCSKRPLRQEELYDAILAGHGPESLVDETEPRAFCQDMRRLISHYSRSLWEITATRVPTVQFIHGSIRDYLLAGNGLEHSGINREIGSLASIHENLKYCCQRYLHLVVGQNPYSGSRSVLFQSVDDVTIDQGLEVRYPFIRYAVRHLFNHAEEAAAHGVEQSKFIQNFDLAVWIHWHNKLEKIRTRHYSPRASLLYIFANENLPQLLRLELERMQHMDILDILQEFCIDPLYAEIAQEDFSAVIELLRPHFQPGNHGIAQDRSLSNMYTHGLNELVVLLLEKTAKTAHLDSDTALSLAIERLVEVLLDTMKVNVEHKLKDGRSIRSLIMESGKEGLIELLLSPNSDLESGFAAKGRFLIESSDSGHTPTEKSRDGSRHILKPDTEQRNMGSFKDKAYKPMILPKASTVTSRRNTYISEIVADLYDFVSSQEFRDSNQDLSKLHVVLPRLLKAFALRIGQEAKSLQHLQIMEFIIKSRRLIGVAFKRRADRSRSQRRLDSAMKSTTVETRRNQIEWMRSMQENFSWDRSHEPDFREVEVFLDDDDNNNNQTQPDLPSYHDFVRSTTAYKLFQSRILREFTLNHIESSSMKQFGREIYGVISRLSQFQEVSKKQPPHFCDMRYEVTWDPLASINEFVLDEGQTISSALTITGAATDAQAVSCSQYMAQTWPLSGEHIMKLIESVIHGTVGTKQTQLLPDGTQVKASLRRSVLDVVACGTIDSIIEVAEQLGWLGAALHPVTDSPEITYCSPMVNEVNVNLSDSPEIAKTNHTKMSCKIDYKLEHIDPRETGQNGQCWHSLFDSQVVVKGYPTLRRPTPIKGLETPLDVMTTLTNAHRVVDFDGYTSIKGFSTILVPTQREGDTISWHVLFNSDGSRISYGDSRIKQLTNGLPLQLTSKELEQCTHIIGWCSNVLSFAGSSCANYQISTCALDEPGPGYAWEKVSICAGKYVAVSGTVALRRKSKAARFRSGTNYFSQLKWLEKQHVVLFDVEKRHAWLIDGVSAVLHLIRMSIKHDAEGILKDSFLLRPEDLREAPDGSSLQGLRSSIYVLTQPMNMSLKLFANQEEIWEEVIESEGKISRITKTKKSYTCLSDRVESMCHRLGQIADHLRRTKEEDGVGFKLKRSPRRQLEGFDFVDIATEEDMCTPRALTLNANGTGWVDLIRGIHGIVLFGRDFGELLSPATTEGICPSWRSLPTGLDHLAVSVFDLNRIMKQHSGTVEERPWRITRDICWHQPDHLFGMCECRRATSGRHGDRVQVLLSAKWYNNHGKWCTSPQTLENNGAVIFGHSWRFRIKGTDGTALPVRPQPSGLEQAIETLSDGESCSGSEQSLPSHTNTSASPSSLGVDNMASPTTSPGTLGTSISDEHGRSDSATREVKESWLQKYLKRKRD